MEQQSFIVKYRITGPIILYLLLAFIGGFITGFAGLYNSLSTVTLLASTGAGLWLVFGLAYEVIIAARGLQNRIKGAPTQ